VIFIILIKNVSGCDITNLKYDLIASVVHCISTGSISPYRNNYIICYGDEQTGNGWRNNEKTGGIDLSNLTCQAADNKYIRIIKEAASGSGLFFYSGEFFDAGNPVVIEPDGALTVPAVKWMDIIVSRHIQDTVGYMESIVSFLDIAGKINGGRDKRMFRLDDM